ncbi:hypothetical protein [Streptomyces tubercidicus]|uniref:hypothetical protein n=1 Tax=Streptomyces tubercidicus TaxID=47759 RepID=UPI00368BFA34
MADAVDFKALDLNPNLLWSDVSGIDWKSVPHGPGPEYTFHARRLAGRVRCFYQFWLPAAHDYAMKLERWLIEYNVEHINPAPRK